MDDFLKQGGIDLEKLEEKKVGQIQEEEPEVEAEPVYNTDPDERMTGWLSYTSQKISGNAEGTDADILGMVVSGIGSGLKLGLKALTETI